MNIKTARNVNENTLTFLSSLDILESVSANWRNKQGVQGGQHGN